MKLLPQCNELIKVSRIKHPELLEVIRTLDIWIDVLNKQYASAGSHQWLEDAVANLEANDSLKEAKKNLFGVLRVEHEQSAVSIAILSRDSVLHREFVELVKERETTQGVTLFAPTSQVANDLQSLKTLCDTHKGHAKFLHFNAFELATFSVLLNDFAAGFLSYTTEEYAKSSSVQPLFTSLFLALVRAQNEIRQCMKQHLHLIEESTNASTATSSTLRKSPQRVVFEVAPQQVPAQTLDLITFIKGQLNGIVGKRHFAVGNSALWQDRSILVAMPNLSVTYPSEEATKAKLSVGDYFKREMKAPLAWKTHARIDLVECTPQLFIYTKKSVERMKMINDEQFVTLASIHAVAASAPAMARQN